MYSDMTSLKIYTQSDVLAFINKRKGEKKFGEKVTFITDAQNLDQELTNSTSKYVLFGINESIGVKANRGRQGTETAWSSALKSLLNTQNSPLNKGKNVLLLGCLEFPEQMARSKKLNTDNSSDLQQLYTMVNEIDEDVTNLMFKIISAGKIPIVIGGGHNNAYGNIKGSTLALNKPINVINFDAHTDFRALEGRHSGNGFSYAFKEGFLNRYFIFGVHENYTSKKILKELSSHNKHINYNTFEAIAIRKETSFENEMQNSKKLARSNWKGSGDKLVEEKWFKVREQLKPTEFLGYEYEKAEGIVLKISKGNQFVETAQNGDDIEIITNQTPFMVSLVVR